MLSYILGVAALSVDPSAHAALSGRLEVGGYVPATCRAPAADPQQGFTRLCSAATTVAVTEQEAEEGGKLIRILVSPL